MGTSLFDKFHSHFLDVFLSTLRIMLSTVKKLEVTYNPINDRNTFGCGDSICGQVTLEVAKVCRIESLSVKFKGKAEAEWTERHGQTTVVYHSKDKYFSFKHYFIGRDNHQEDDEQILLPNDNLNTCKYFKVVS
ncbi:arrestin domain-containing protein 3-like [Stegastes partitus]|uniref:Arrestin domain-containing protein 3-like n=1 Tax=Stegastes partitus TaxID=144197 RepID=A0A9Y4NVK7_9TELE|nr:PREDICTED: arrestin domain-containing protein 3-like [Stegastes partitus]